MQDDFISRIAQELKDTYHCHTAILYGSRATGDFNASSDYDLAAFAPIADVQRIAEWREGQYLDLFIYPEARLLAADDEFLKLLDGRVLFEGENAGTRLLTMVQAHFHKGPTPLPPDESSARRVWAWKMLRRAEVGDSEGHYRRHWLLMALLEDWFQLRTQWYLGPKRSLNFLRQHHPETYACFEKALHPQASLAEISALIALVTGLNAPPA